MGETPEPPLTAAFRLRRSQRIRKRPDFVRIQDSPVRVSTRHLLLLFSSGGEVTRLGVVASRKVGPSVVRNRCKRLVREVFRLHPEIFPPGVDVVIIVRPGTHLLRREDLEGEVKGAAPQLARRARELARRQPGQA
jgi:ribonuclease P protein component